MIWVRTGAEVGAVVSVFICALERQIQTTTGERNEGKPSSVSALAKCNAT